MSEDAAFLVFDSLDNLPSEIQALYEDVRIIDVRATDSLKKIKTRDGQLGKFIKTSGSLERNPKEETYYPKIRADFTKTLEKSYEKEELAKKALELLDRTLRKLDEETKKVVALEGAGGSLSQSGYSTPTSDRSPAVRGDGAAAHLMPGQNTPLKNNNKDHKRARSSFSARPAIPSGLSGPPLLPNGYPAPPPPGGSDEEAGEDTTTYCFCEQVSYGEMVACDNDSCQREWFHYGCVGLKEPPVGKWYCSECVKA